MDHLGLDPVLSNNAKSTLSDYHVQDTPESSVSSSTTASSHSENHLHFQKIETRNPAAS